MIKVLGKISQVMARVQFLKKDGKVEFGSTKYKYLSEAKITENIRQACLDVGLVILPIKAEQLESDVKTMAKIKITYRLFDKDSGEYVDTEMIGYGADTQDKSIYKAITGCYKYLQRQVFAIPTNETDPDKITSDELDVEISKYEKQKKEEQEIEESTKAQLDMLDKAIEIEETKKEVMQFIGKSAAEELKKKGLTEVQRVHILAKKKGKTQDMRNYIKLKFNKESMNDLTKEELISIKQVLEKYPDIVDTKVSKDTQ